MSRQFSVAKHTKFIIRSYNPWTKTINREAAMHFPVALLSSDFFFSFCSLKYQVPSVNSLQTCWANCFQQMRVRSLQRCSELHAVTLRSGWEMVVRVSYTLQHALNVLKKVIAARRNYSMFNISVVTSLEKQYRHLVTITLLSFNDNSTEHRMIETCTCWMVNAQPALQCWCLVSYWVKYWTNCSSKISSNLL